MRHGESTRKCENRFVCVTDVDLTEQGLSETHALVMNAAANQGKAKA